MFFNFGIPGGTAGEQTYYWDDVQFVEPIPVDLPITFEDSNVDYNLADFDGNTSMIVVDPTDPNNMVVEAFRDAAAQTWAGTTAGGNGLANPVPFTADATKMTVRVWSPNADTPIRLKVEDAADNTISVETEVNTTMAMAWETLEFDFSMEAMGTPALDLANTYDKVSIFFNFGTDGATAGEQTYYFDDIMFVVPPLQQVDLPITFEETNVDYNLAGFDGNTTTIVVDPTDPNNMVAEAFRDAAAQTWAGTTAGGNGLANPIPFTTEETKMTVRVWSPNADTPIRLKVEDSADPTISVETEVNTTMAMAWETLEFDFSMEAMGTPALDLANTYDKVSIFCNFGTDGATAGEQTYYFDDILFVTTPLEQVDLPITFEESNINYDLVGFEGNMSMIVEDPTDPTNMVAEAIKGADAQPWAGTTAGGTGLANAIPFAANQTKMTVRVWSPTANTPIRLKVEDVTDPTISVETEAMTTTAMAWETLEFDFDNEAAGTAEINLANTYNMVSIFFNFGTDGATAGEQTYYFDDIMFDATPPLNQVDLPVTFEDDMVDYNFIDFGEAVSQRVVDPTNPVNMVMETTKPETAVEWAGTIIGNDDGFVNTIPFTATEQKMNVRVWSPAADMPILLKVENVADSDIFVQTLTNTTKSMEWETLEFDFANPEMSSPALDLAQTYGKGVIFFNFGTTGADAGPLTFYWDDVNFGAIDVSVDNVATANIKVSPNPANEFINIEFPEAIVSATAATLMDVSGKVMLHTDINNRAT